MAVSPITANQGEPNTGTTHAWWLQAADGAIAGIGATTDASSANSLVGLLKKLISLLPAALGITTKANSLSVALASDQATDIAPLRVDPIGATTQPVSGTVTVNGTVTANAGTGDFTVIKPGQWSVMHVPAANTQATATKTAAGVGIRNYATAISVTLLAGAGAGAAAIAVSLIDGASGGAGYLWRSVIGVPGVAGSTTTINLDDLNLQGGANTAMTLEFSAAGGANVNESVTLIGYSL